MNLNPRLSLALAIAVCALVAALSPGDDSQRMMQPSSSDAQEDLRSDRPVSELLFANSLSSHELGILAAFFQVQGYVHLPTGVTITDAQEGTVLLLGQGQLADGSQLHFPDVIGIGETVSRGILLNIGWKALSITIENPANGEMIDLDFGSPWIVAVGDIISDGQHPALPAANGCSVTCAAGYFSCCYCINGQPVCTCHNFNNPPQHICQAGGPGSESCSITGCGGPEPEP